MNDPNSPTTDPEFAGGRGSQAITVLGVALAVAPFVAATIVWHRHGLTSIGDIALTELRIRNIPGDLPSSGVYSRFGYRHPGPAMFYLFWVPYHVLGANGAALLTSMALWSASLSAILVVTTTRIHGVVAGMLAASATSALILVAGPKSVIEAWNPSMTTAVGLVLPCLVYLSLRSRSAAVAVPVVATIGIQAHLGVAVLAGAMCGLWIILPFAAHRFAAIPIDRSFIKARLGGAAVASVLWIPPLIDAIFGANNLGAIVRINSASDQTDPTVGVPAALRMLSNTFSVDPWWLIAHHPGPLSLAAAGTSVPILAAGPVLAILVLWRRRGSREAILSATVVTVAVGAILVSLAGVRGIPYPYLVQWAPGVVLASLAIPLIANGQVRGVANPTHTPRSVSRTPVLAGATVLAFCLSLVAIVDAAHTTSTPDPKPFAADERIEREGAPAARRLWDQLKAHVNTDETVVLRSGYDEVGPALAVFADQQGATMLLPPVYDLALPPSMMASEGEHTWALYTDADAMQITQDRSKEILASDFPFTEAELATLKPLWEAIQAASERGDADAVTAANQRVVNTVLDRRARVIVRVS